MHLKSVEMQGFKSFYDKTVIQFQNGVTAIVGPNGMGKSNIADAIRWVFGEQSTKVLRGSKMEDVIFNGTQKRSAAGFAQVTLTIDNTDGTLPVDFTEVSIGRRLYRSGESEYTINRSQVRLKDIHELFMNTGLGRGGYSIIGQGKIAEILSDNGNDRRQMIEEAVGIAKYRYNKQDAERKLNSTEENLVRACDILSTLEERVGPLEAEAEKAKKYLLLAAEKRGLEVTLWLEGIDKIRQSLGKLEEDHQTLKVQVDLSAEKLALLEERENELARQAQESSLESQRARESIAAWNEDLAARKTELSLLEKEREHARLQIAAELAEIETLEASRGDAGKSFEAAQQVVEKAGAELHKLGEALSAMSERILQSGHLLEMQQQDLEVLEQQQQQRRNELQELLIASSSNEAAEQSVRERLVAIEQEKERREQQVVECRRECTRVRRELEEAEDDKQSFENIRQGLAMRAEGKRKKMEQEQARCEELRHACADRRQRIDILTQMEQHFEGFGESVKTVMQQAKEGRLKGICGPVSKLISVQEPYALAVETALGNAVQNIVTQTENDAKQAIFMLRDRRAGRATFLPMNVIRAQTLNAEGVENFAGSHGVAAKKVNCEQAYRAVVDNLLGRTVICEDMDAAIAMAKAYDHRFRIVTLDGQIMNSGGSMMGGSAAKQAGILSRSAKIRALQEELEQLQEKLKESTQKVEQARLELETEEAQAKATLAEGQTAAEQVVALRAELQSAETILAAAVQGGEALEQEAETLREKTLTVDSYRRELEEKQEALKQQIRAVQAEMEEARGRARAAEAERDALREEETGLRVQLSGAEEVLRGAREKAAYIGESQNRLEESIAARRLQIAKAEEQIGEYTLQWETTSENCKETEQRILAQTAKVSEQTQRHEELERAMTECRKAQREQNAQREQLLMDFTRVDGKLTSSRSEHDALVRKLWDEYELTYVTAAQERVEIESVSKANSRVSQLRGQIRQLGSVNVNAVEEYKEVSEKYEFLKKQVEDLQQAKESLLDIIRQLTGKMKELFSDSFNEINRSFDLVFRELFGGGKAELVLADPENILDSEIQIRVCPPGKIVKNISALSGGEQAFSAIALYFAFQRMRPTPFCVLDEIEAALDEVNVTKFAQYLQKYSDRTQFIVITHRRGTMESADGLYGVTMPEQGVSKFITLNVSEVERRLGLKLNK